MAKRRYYYTGNKERFGEESFLMPIKDWTPLAEAAARDTAAAMRDAEALPWSGSSGREVVFRDPSCSVNGSSRTITVRTQYAAGLAHDHPLALPECRNYLSALRQGYIGHPTELTTSGEYSIRDDKRSIELYIESVRRSTSTLAYLVDKRSRELRILAGAGVKIEDPALCGDRDYSPDIRLYNGVIEKVWHHVELAIVESFLGHEPTKEEVRSAIESAIKALLIGDVNHVQQKA